jgi:hypothetical protein
MIIKTTHIPWIPYSKSIKSLRTTEILANVLMRYSRSVKIRKENDKYQLYIREGGTK